MIDDNLAMIGEYALIPDVFDATCYSRPEYIDMCLPHLKAALYNEAIIRDLSDGEWSNWCSTPERMNSSHRLTKELLRKLKSRNRLHPFPRQSRSCPDDPQEWCDEALRSHVASRLSGIIASDQMKTGFLAEPLVASIEKLSGCPWWQSRSCSAILERSTQSFLSALWRILACANSLMFIDPNLNPTNKNYSDFFRLLEPLKDRSPVPLVELHRSHCLGDGRDRKVPRDAEEGRALFLPLFAPLDRELKRLGLKAEVFFWQDFHARYLITDLIGILAEAGFDVTRDAQKTTWARVSSADRDKIQRDFERQDFKFRFEIGGRSGTER
jgi:hypothetical protein